MQMFMAATILERGCREPSVRIHMNSAGDHENSATGYGVAERPLFELSTAWLPSLIHPLPTAVDRGQSVLRWRGSAGRHWVGWRVENSATLIIGI